MAEPTPTSESSSKPEAQSSSSTYVPPTPLRCFIGATISGPIAIALYFLTRSIAETFANKPITTTNELAIKIGLAVRTLVVGMSTLGTGIFAIATLGLIALGIQLIFKDLTSTSD